MMILSVANITNYNFEFMENIFAEDQQPKRPTMLTVLCVLTFIGSGFTLLSNLSATLMSASVLDAVRDFYESAGYGSLYDTMEASMLAFKRVAPYMLLFTLVSLFGAIVMFRLKRMGFFLYAAAQLIMLVFPLCFGADINILSLFFTLLFVVLYAVQLKYMN